MFRITHAVAVMALITLAACNPIKESSPATTDEDLESAIERAQDAIRNCYALFPGPCDEDELEGALTGTELAKLQDYEKAAATENVRYDSLDRMTWTTLEGPTLKNEELATAVVCLVDGVVSVDDSTGAVLSDAVAIYLQKWHLQPVDGTWKLSETVNTAQGFEEDGNPCDEAA